MSDLNEDEKTFLEEIENEMKNRYDSENDAEFKEYLTRDKLTPPIIEFKKENNTNYNYKRRNDDYREYHNNKYHKK